MWGNLMYLLTFVVVPSVMMHSVYSRRNSDNTHTQLQGLSREKADDEKAQRAAEAAKLHAEECIRQAAEAEARAKTPYEEVDADGPTPCHAVFKAEGFGMLEAMTQVRIAGYLLFFFLSRKTLVIAN